MNTNHFSNFSYKKLIKLAISPILMMLFISAYSVIDGLFISNFVGPLAFAGLNLIGPITMVIGAVGFMLGTGGSALVAKKLGENKTTEANQIFSGIFYCVIIIGLILSLICYIFIEQIAILLGATPEILPFAITYGEIFMFGEVAFMIQNMFQSFCATANKSGLGFLLSVLSGILNIGLDALFILVFKMGISGAAYATVLAQIIGTVITIIYFSKDNKSLLKLTKPSFKPKNIIKALTNGSSEFLSNIATSIVSICFNLQLITHIGSNGVVTYGILMHISFLFNSIFMGYTVAITPIVAFNFGAKNNKEIKNLLNKSIMLNIFAGILLTTTAIILAKPLSNIFIINNIDLLNYTTNVLKLFAFSYLIYGFNTFITSFFTSLNNGFVSGTISLFRTLIFQAGCVLILPVIFGANGIWYSIIIAECLSLILNSCLLLIYKEKYKY